MENATFTIVIGSDLHVYTGRVERNKTRCRKCQMSQYAHTLQHNVVLNGLQPIGIRGALVASGLLYTGAILATFWPWYKVRLHWHLTGASSASFAFVELLCL